MKFEWEEISNNSDKKGENWWESTYRAKVIGGWLIRHECAYEYIYHLKKDLTHDIEEEWNKRNHSMIFISDPAHLWEIESD